MGVSSNGFRQLLFLYDRRRKVTKLRRRRERSRKRLHHPLELLGPTLRLRPLQPLKHHCLLDPFKDLFPHPRQLFRFPFLHLIHLPLSRRSPGQRNDESELGKNVRRGKQMEQYERKIYIRQSRRGESRKSRIKPKPSRE